MGLSDLGGTRSVFLWDGSRQEIQKLQKEHEELQCSLRVSESNARRLRDTEATHSLRSTLERCDEVEEQLEREKQAIALLDQEVAYVLEQMLSALHNSLTWVEGR